MDTSGGPGTTRVEDALNPYQVGLGVGGRVSSADLSDLQWSP